MSTSPTGSQHPGPDASRPRTARRGGFVGWVVLVVLVALLAGSVTFAVTQVRQHRADEARASDRRDAQSVAEQFTLRLDSLSYKDIAGYKKRLGTLLTPKMRSDFGQSFEGFDQAFTAIQFTSKGQVRAAGISDIDQDSATVLVIHDVKVTSKGCVQPPYKRMTVDLRKIGGKWLVDDFSEDVPGCAGTGTTGSGQ